MSRRLGLGKRTREQIVLTKKIPKRMFRLKNRIMLIRISEARLIKSSLWKHGLSGVGY